MTLASYSALMKVYAYCGLHDRVFDLNPQLCEEGLAPDPIMYGCLIHFAGECGRTELLKELAGAAPHLDIQNFMSLIRAAGRDKDVARALCMMAKLEASEATLDAAVFNSVLDACVCAGDLGRARSFAQAIHTIPIPVTAQSPNCRTWAAPQTLRLGAAHARAGPILFSVCPGRHRWS